MSQTIKITDPVRLKNFDPDFHDGMKKEEAKDQTAILVERIGELQERLYANANQALLVILQGMDTSGKDGATHHVFQQVSPAGIETTNFKTPSSEELAHDFLWRAHKAIPRYGNIGVFNRSYYEDVLIVRVMNIKPPAVWRRRYEQINAFEKNLVDNNILLLKFFLHISKGEQAERLKERINDPRKNWKFQPEDLKMRDKWPQFMIAYEDALNNCSTPYAPWHLIPANRKWFRDFLITKTVVKALENLNLSWPKPHQDLKKFKIT
jgi:PPK2 family polyphosphate:nucleotide phosphotransferase